MRSLLHDATALANRTIAIRRTLHRKPEVGLNLPATKAALIAEIADLNLKLRLSETTSSLVAELDGARPGPTLILRADMDALPVREEVGLPFASEVQGAMHACGHDFHAAMLASAARLLASRRSEIAGRVLLFFQAGEEGHHGAKRALDEGQLDDDNDIIGAFALHVSSTHESGTIHVRPGPFMAANDTFRVTLTGRGGHASAPQRANNPVPVAGEVVTALQGALINKVGPLELGHLAVTQLAAGTKANTIPAAATIGGTTRTLSPDLRERVHQLVSTVVGGIAVAHGVEAEILINRGYPPTVNDPAFTAIVRAAAETAVGSTIVHDLPSQSMGAEDFSYILERHPGTLAFLGACPPGIALDDAPYSHSSLFVIDEAALPTGVATYAAVALDVLRAID